MYKRLLKDKQPRHLLKEDKWNGIVLKSEDFLVLFQIYIHSSMRSPSIHEIFQMTYGKERNSNWITNRLRKLVKAGLLEQMNESMGERSQVAGMTYYHYRLNKRGYQLLVKEGIVREDDAQKVLVQSKRKKLPTIHTRAASYLANMIFLELMSEEKLDDFTHIRGSRHIHLGIAEETEKSDVLGLIVPDWVFERGDTIVSIEVDTGSQRGEKINDKYRMYSKTAKHLKSIGKTLVVVFAVTDMSIMDFALGKDLRKENRDKRIGSLKELFPLYTEWPDNLHFYVATARRVPEIVARLLSNQEPAQSLDRMLDANTWYELVMNRLQDNREMNMEELSTVLLPNRNRQLDPEYVFSVKEGNAVKERHLVIFGEEGSVRNYQYIRNNAHLTYQYNANPKQDVPLFTNVVYGTKKSAKQEVYGNDIYESIYFHDLETIKQDTAIQEQVIMKQKLISPFKKEEVEMFK